MRLASYRHSLSVICSFNDQRLRFKVQSVRIRRERDNANSKLIAKLQYIILTAKKIIYNS
jgi:hypothetical protein